MAGYMGKRTGLKKSKLKLMLYIYELGLILLCCKIKTTLVVLFQTSEYEFSASYL